MSRKTFGKVIYPELNGGINVRDYPTEIQDKQATVIKNFNFEGNKLVSSKDCDSIYASVTGNPINGMTVDGSGDVWYIQSGKIYKNGIEQMNIGTSKITISFTSQIEGQYYTFMSVDGTQLILTGNSISSIVTQISTTLGGLYTVTNPSGNDIAISRSDGIVPMIQNTQKTIYNISYSSINTIGGYKYLCLTIDGVNYSFKGSDLAGVVADINSVLPTYHAWDNSGNISIRKSDWSNLNINNEITLIKYFDIENWNEHKKVSITIDGTTFTFDGTVEKTSIYNTIASSLSSTHYSYIGSGITLIKKTGSQTVITYNSFDRYTYKLSYRYGDTPNSGQYWDYSNISINGTQVTVDGSKNRAFFGHEIIYKLTSYTALNSFNHGGQNYGNGTYGIKITTLYTSNTARVVFHQGTTGYLKDSSGNTLQTVTLNGGVGIFNYSFQANTVYRFEADVPSVYTEFVSFPSSNYFVFNILGGSKNGTDFGVTTNVSSITINSNPFPSTTIIGKLWRSGNSSDTETEYTGSLYYYGAWHDLNIRKNDYSPMNINSINYYTGGFPSDLNFTSIDEYINSTTVSMSNTSNTTTIGTTVTQAYTIVVTGTKYPYNDTIYDITVGNLGVLITDRRGIDAYYYDRNAHICRLLPTQVVGSPRIGTFWDGRTYLGGYADTDNIMWSQQANDIGSTTPVGDRYYTFGGGNGSGTQSISNGNKGKIVGFLGKDDGLYIFKEDGIYKTNRIQVLKTDTNQDGTYETTEIQSGHSFTRISGNGALSQSVITEVSRDVFFYDHIARAVRRLSYEGNSKLEDNAISDEIAPLLKSLPEQQFLANASFKYPLYKLNLSDSSAPLVRLWNGSSGDPGVSSPGQFYIPNITLVYNVETKCWTIENNKNTTSKRPLFSYKGYFSGETGIMFKDDVGYYDTGEYYSKWYSFSNTKDYKKFGLAHIFGKIIPTSGYAKSLQMQVYIDGVKVDDRTVSSNVEKEIEIRVDLYDIGRYIEVRLFHSGKGKVEVYDLGFEVKQSPSYTSEYY